MKFETSPEAKTRLDELAREAVRRLWAPPPKLSMSEWADRYRVLSAGTSAVPGRWRTARAPHTREIMDTISDRKSHEVVVMTPSQAGKTETLLNTIGYYIHQEPSPILLVQPRVEDAKSFSKDRLQRMLDDSPALSNFVAQAKSRDSGNTIQHKMFPGGDIFMTGANAPAGLAMRPRRIVLFDEVDRYPASSGDEGDPITIAKARTVTYQSTAKIVYVSSPTIEGKSRIARIYGQSDKRRWNVPCPHCGEEQILKWGRVRWDGRDDKDADQATKYARYECSECGVLWDESDRQRAVVKGRWVAENPGSNIAGFWLGGLDSPFTSMARLADSYVQTRGNPEEEKSFINTKLGRLWSERGEAPEAERIFERRESYPIRQVPDRAVLLTAGVDVQDNRLEMEVVAWARGHESWSIDYLVIDGNPSARETWDRLTAAINETYFRADGWPYKIERLVIDTGGHFTQHVYNWARSLGDNRVMLGKGQGRMSTPLGRPTWVDMTIGGKTIKNACQLWPIGINGLKAELYSWLKLSKPDEGEFAPGYCHFPMYEIEHFRQLTAEQMKRVVDRRGYATTEWIKAYHRNEALDVRVYARAAVIAYGTDRWTDDDWSYQERHLGIGDEPEALAAKPETIESEQPVKPHAPLDYGVRRGSFWN